MPFIASWATTDQCVLLNLEGVVLEVFKQHIQRRLTDNEAGGLLLGSVHGENLSILEATAPTALDKRLRYFFERLSFGHSSIAKKRWRESQGSVRYLGEWHTHPEDVPHPSSLDRNEWTRLASARIDGRPVLAIVVGRHELRVELIAASGESRRLFALPSA
jgi:integrative and conjugative element protein (TIGR02256 family)